MALAGSNRSSGMDAYLNFRTYQHGQRTKNLRRMQATCSLNSAIMILIEYIYICWIILIYHNPSQWRCMTATTALSRSTSLAWWLVECLACPRFGSRHVVSCPWKKRRFCGLLQISTSFGWPWARAGYSSALVWQWLALWSILPMMIASKVCRRNREKKTSTDRTLSSEFNRVVQVFRHFQMFFQGHTAHIIMTISSKKKRIT